MKDLKEMGLNPIDEKQAENVNGGGDISFVDLNIRIEYCCMNIPPMSFPL